MVMKETWESVRALDALLQGGRMLAVFRGFGITDDVDLHPSPDIDITAGNLRRAEEDVSAVPTRTINPHGVLAAVRLGAVQGDFTTLVTVGCVGRPCRLIPSALEALGDLSEG